MELARLQLQPVGLGGAQPAAKGRPVVDGQIERGVGHHAVHGGVVDLLHGFHAQPAPAALIGHGAVHEPVAQHQHAALHRRADDLADVLGARGGVEQRLAGGAHVGVGGIEDDAADVLADGAAARLARAQHAEAELAQALFQKLGLGGLAAAVGAFDGQEKAARDLPAGAENRAQALGIRRHDRRARHDQLLLGAAAVARADALDAVFQRARHVELAVAHHGGAAVAVRQRPADELGLAQPGRRVLLAHHGVKVALQREVGQDIPCQPQRLGGGQAHVYPRLAQHAQDAANVGVHAVEVHAPGAEIAPVALHGLGHARLGHIQQVAEGIRQRRAHHLAQVRVLGNLQPHLVHGPAHGGDDPVLRVKQRAVQIKNHRVIGVNVHSNLLYRTHASVPPGPRPNERRPSSDARYAAISSVTRSPAQISAVPGG